MRRRFAIAVLAWVWVAVFTLSSTVLAQGLGRRQSFVNPFPSGDTYKVRVVGDWLADSLVSYLADALGEENQVHTDGKVITVRTLRQNSWERRVEDVERAVNASTPDIMVVLFGVSEFGSLRVPGRKRMWFASEGWKAQYSQRIDQLMKVLRRHDGAVYWLGMPPLRKADRNEGARFVNEVFRERAYISNIKYIDTFSGFADENGNYSAYGPDIDGKTRLLRTKGGVYFTSTGYRKMAHFAARIIKRDLRKAKAERNVPLAGSELEQNRINPQKTKKKKSKQAKSKSVEERRWALTGRIGSTATSAPSPIVTRTGLKDQKADHSTVTLKLSEADVKRVEKVQILRPAIPATVLALLTRRRSSERATQLGDYVTTELPGGVVVLSSVSAIAPAPVGGERARHLPTQSPFFKVWVKGERLKPLPGRADDIEWPRPEPRAIVRAKFNASSPSNSSQQRAVIYEHSDETEAKTLTSDTLPPLPIPNPGKVLRR